MKTNPLTQDLYSIDWSGRFEQYEQFNQTAGKDLDNVLKNIEGIVKSSINLKDVDDMERLQQRYKNAKKGSPEKRAMAMLIDLKTLSAAREKHLGHTATTSAMQIMGDLWRSLSEEIEQTTDNIPQLTKPVSSKKSEQKKNQKTARQLPKLKLEEYTSKKRNKQENTKNTDDGPVTGNVVIKNLAEHVGKMGGKKADEPSKKAEPNIKEPDAPEEDKRPMSVRCTEVANMLADEYPHYTLTAIRVMTAEKLGVTRQYLENLDIKPKRFK